eukprot:257088_1
MRTIINILPSDRNVININITTQNQLPFNQNQTIKCCTLLRNNRQKLEMLKQKYNDCYGNQYNNNNDKSLGPLSTNVKTNFPKPSPTTMIVNQQKKKRKRKLTKNIKIYYPFNQSPKHNSNSHCVKYGHIKQTNIKHIAAQSKNDNKDPFFVNKVARDMRKG